MHKTLRKIEETLDVMMGSEEAKTEPATEVYDADLVNYEEQWNPEDNTIDDFNLLVTDPKEIKLGMLIKHNNNIMQVCGILNHHNVFDCKRHDRETVYRVDVSSKLFKSNPKKIRDHVKFEGRRAMKNYSSFGNHGYHPKQYEPPNASPAPPDPKFRTY